jgi:hypothetical protein
VAGDPVRHRRYGAAGVADPDGLTGNDIHSMRGTYKLFPAFVFLGKTDKNPGSGGNFPFTNGVGYDILSQRVDI